MTARTAGRRPAVRRKRAAAGTAASAVMAEPEAPAYVFNPGPEFSRRVRMDGAGIVNSGRFAVVAGSGGNTVLIGETAAGGSGLPRGDGDPSAYRATACPAKCQCLEFQQRAACPHVLAAMIVRAGYGGSIGGRAGRRGCGA